MEFLLGSAVGAFLVTAGAAWLLVRRWRRASFGAQVACSALSFPALSFLVFVLATGVTLIGDGKPSEPGDALGMVLFSLFFFMFVAAAIGLFVGIPTAFVLVSVLRGRRPASDDPLAPRGPEAP